MKKYYTLKLKNLFIICHLLIIVFLLNNCTSTKTENDDVSEIENKAALKAGNIFGAKSCKVKREKTTNKAGEEITLTTVSLDSINLPTNYKKSKITSTAALIFHTETAALNYKRSDSLFVILNLADTVYKKRYQLADIEKADTLIKGAFLFINDLQKNDYSHINTQIDSLKIKATELKRISSLLLSLDSAYGKITKLTATGFSYNNITDTNERLLIIWIEINNNQKTSFCTFYVSLSSKKIIYLSINSKEND